MITGINRSYLKYDFNPSIIFHLVKGMMGPPNEKVKHTISLKNQQTNQAVFTGNLDCIIGVAICRDFPRMLHFSLVIMLLRGGETEMRNFVHRQVVFVFIAGVLIFILSKPLIAQNKQDMEKIASVFHAEDIMVTQWSIHARESLPNINNKEKLNHYTMKIKEQFPNWNWETNTNEQQIEIIGTNKHNQFQETIKMVLPNEKNAEFVVLYNIDGEVWNKSIQKSLVKVSKYRKDAIFQGNATFFYCMKGKYNDKIEKDLSQKANSLKKAFHADELGGLAEQSFISMTTYSPYFHEIIDDGNKQMNLQIALRHTGLDVPTTVIVGTPIITIEY